MGRIDDIRNAAANENVSITSVLHQCLNYAINTGDEELRSWVNLELNGYSDDNDLPAYRIIQTESMGTSVGRGYVHKNAQVPTLGLDADVKERARTLRIYDGVDTLMTMALSDNLVRTWSEYDLWKLNQRWQPEGIRWTSVSKVFPIGSVRGVLGAIRTRVLNYPFKESAIESGRPKKSFRRSAVIANPRVVPSSPNNVRPDTALTGPAKLFIAYPHKDKRHRNELVKHLSSLQRQGVIETWYDGLIVPGQEWEPEIIQHLEAADIILLLVSADFIASDYCYRKELTRAKERHERGKATVIPIMVRPVDYRGEWFATLQMLPEDGRPVTDWPNRDKAWTNVAKGIRGAIEKQLAKL